ncbi:hypothetical protein ALC53_01222 [Atta colombica]|uniref:Uncharacterized protein n=1 Tax=Atta colombica TaxID=520822 RepID=A0A195BU70_9HYME|nr:hypothetical protein ALC53_01222 [Atta colombica]
MDVDGEHEYYEMETDAFLRPRGSKFGPGSPSTFGEFLAKRYRPSFHIERCPQGGHLYILRGSFDGLAGFAVPETDTKGEPQRTRMDAPLTRTQKTDTRSLQKHRVENEKIIRLVEIAGKQRKTITPSYSEDVTRAGTVASAGSRVNVSRGKARRKLCREGSRLGAWDARKIWDGRGITGRKSQDNRNEIEPTVKNVGFLKVNKGRTAEESWIRRQIIVCTIEVLSLSALRVEKTTRSRVDSVEQKKKDLRTRSEKENKREILSTSKEIRRNVRLLEVSPEVTPFQIDPSIEPVFARVARCDGGVKCAVITGGRGKTGKKVVNMTPIFLVVLLAIDPIIAQNTGE